MKNEYIKVAHKLTNFLFNSQIKLDRIEIRLKDFGDNIFYGKSDIRFTKKEKHTFHFFLNQKNELFINNKRDISTADGPYNTNEPFRLNPYKIIKEKKIYNFNKTKLIKRVLHQIAIILKHTYYEHLNYINAEGREYTPRCMGNFYADAYSAYCFAKIYLERKDKIYLNSCLLALNFINRTYENYPKDVVWYHHDFKNPAYIETVFLIKDYISDEEFKKYSSLIKRLREDFYEPINVFALRLHWRSARKYHGFKDNMMRINNCINILKKNQTKEGLIHDNNKEYWWYVRS